MGWPSERTGGPAVGVIIGRVLFEAAFQASGGPKCPGNGTHLSASRGSCTITVRRGIDLGLHGRWSCFFVVALNLFVFVFDLFVDVMFLS